MSVRIYKYATQSSIVDVSPALNYYKTNKYNEEEYKGSIQFVIHQYTREKQARSYLPKATAKMIMNSIIQHNFPRLFTNGFTNYGGSPQKRIARIFNIRFDSEQKKYILKIDEGDGKITDNGAIQMVKKNVSVVAYIPYDEMLKIAYETIDFINHAELVAMMKGKPLYTIVPEYQQNLQTGQDL